MGPSRRSVDFLVTFAEQAYLTMDSHPTNGDNLEVLPRRLQRCLAEPTDNDPLSRMLRIMMTFQMTQWLGLVCVLTCFTKCVCVSECVADDKLALSVSIDQNLQRTFENVGVTPAPLVGDSEFARRVTLDLAGRIPTPRELKEFLADTEIGKRERLVDELMVSEDYAFHARNELDIQLLARLQWNNDWRAYLLQATREHRTWNRVFCEILLPEKMRPEDKGAVAFLKQRANDLDAMTNDTSTLFFGVNIACAKCHDHPLVADWHQDHYFGFAKFFKRTFATRSGLMAERFDGDLKFTTTAGEEKRAAFMFLNGESIVEPELSRSAEEWTEIREKIKQAESNDKAAPPPTPSFSPREQMVSFALDSSKSNLLARNAANRIWARLMGRGLIHPVDQMHSENPASHPELLNDLANELADHDYDTRPLIRGIVLSDAYARGSLLPDSAHFPSPEWFAVRAPRPLTPFQYALSLWIASKNPDSLPGRDKPADWPKIREQWEQRAEQFARRFEIPEEHFQVSVEEALLLSNSPQVEGEFLRNQSDTLVGYLQSVGDEQEIINAGFFNVLGRAPKEDERAVVRLYLGGRLDRRDQAVQQWVWALLTSAEFRFNH